MDINIQQHENRVYGVVQLSHGWTRVACFNTRLLAVNVIRVWAVCNFFLHQSCDLSFPSQKFKKCNYLLIFHLFTWEVEWRKCCHSPSNSNLIWEWQKNHSSRPRKRKFGKYGGNKIKLKKLCCFLKTKDLQINV